MPRYAVSVAADIQGITQGNPVENLSDRELMERIDARLDRLEADWAGMLRAWSAGGLRALREAARGLNNGR